MRQVADGNENRARPIIIGVGTVILLVGFVVFRARTYSYCASLDEHLSIVASGQTCAANESPIELQTAWRIQGGAGKIKTIGQMVVRAFVPN